MLLNKLNASMTKVSVQQEINEFFSQVLSKSHINLYSKKDLGFVLNTF